MNKISSENMLASFALLRLGSAPGLGFSLRSFASEGWKEVQPEGVVAVLPARFPGFVTLGLESDARLWSVPASLALAAAA